MIDQIEPRQTASSGASEISDSIRGLQAVVSRKEAEKQAALSAQADAEAETAAARRELEEVRALLDSSTPDPYQDPNKAPRQRHAETDPLASISWSDVGLPDRDR